MARRVRGYGVALGQPWRNGAHMSHPKAAEGLVDNAAPQFVDLQVPARSEIRESSKGPHAPHRGHILAGAMVFDLVELSKEGELYRKVPKSLELIRLRHYIVKTRRRT